MSVHYNDDNSHVFVNGKENCHFKANHKNVNFPTRFYLGSISNGFHAVKYGEKYLNGNVYGVSVDCNAIDKFDTLNIHKCLMVKDRTKNCSGWLNKYLLYCWVLADLLARIINAPDHTKCSSLNNQQCVTQPTFINLNPNEYIQELVISICS